MRHFAAVVLPLALSLQFISPVTVPVTAQIPSFPAWKVNTGASFLFTTNEVLADRIQALGALSATARTRLNALATGNVPVVVTTPADAGEWSSGYRLDPKALFR